MTSELRKPVYKTTRVERLFALIAAAGIILLVAYLVIRNQPFADPNLVVLTRTILSLGIAILGGTIPGFLNIGWNVKGISIRAGGALALFALTFLLTPSVLPMLKDAAIPPLKNPRKISQNSWGSETLSFISTAQAQTAVGPLKVRAVYEGDGDKQRKYYDVLISNTSDEQRLISSFKVRWLYSKGIFSAVDYGTSVKPVERYTVGLFVDPDKAYTLMEKSVTVYPPLVLPPKNASGPSVTSIRLEVYYTFEGARINWHPNTDWDLFYEISIQDDAGSTEKVMSRSWRRGDAPNWPKQFKDQTE